MEENSNKKKKNMITKGLRLKECREENHLTQANIAELLNCSNNHISMIERGERDLTYKNAKTLSDYLNISTDYLMCDSDYKTMKEEMSASSIFQYDKEKIFRRLLDLQQISLTIHFKGIDDPEETKFLNSQDINMSSINGPEQTCIITFEDGTVKSYEIDCIAIIDYTTDKKLHIIDKDTYNELKEDIERYIHYKIMELFTISERKQKILHNIKKSFDFYGKYGKHIQKMESFDND